MPAKLFERYKDLQKYVGWADDDAARIASVADVVGQHIDVLIKDFYQEIKRHPEAARVITGGDAQISRLMNSLKTWLRESMQGRSDVAYVTRRWNIGLRHAEIGLNPAYTAAAMSRLRNGIVSILAANISSTAVELAPLVQSFNKLLDLDLAIIQDAYESEYLRRERLAEHERSEVKFGMLVEAAAGLVMIVRQDHSIAYISPYCESMTGYPAAESIGKPFTTLFVAESARTSFSTAIDAAFVGKSIKAYDGPIVHRDGRIRWFIWNAQRLDDFDGQAAVLAVGQDFTERREEQERMLRSERLAGIGQMITGIAHESRNALQRIQSCTEMLELEVENNQEAQRLVSRLQQAQDNLLRLFDEVRNYAAPIQLEKSPCHLASAWREAWGLLENLHRGRDATLLEQPGSADSELSVDRFRMVQVFRNLLENSLAACVDPAVIEIECVAAHLQGAPALEIRIHDNGPGLSPAAKQSVFEPFFTTKTKGTGLGMAIARRIVEAHGGQISVGTENSTGADFFIILPKVTA